MQVREYQHLQLYCYIVRYQRTKHHNKIIRWRSSLREERHRRSENHFYGHDGGIFSKRPAGHLSETTRSGCEEVWTENDFT